VRVLITEFSHNNAFKAAIAKSMITSIRTSLAAYCTNPGQLLPRYAYLASGPVINVNVQATSAAPLITQAPQNASVTEGAQASFSVAATGTSLAYQWQRSNNGGTSYTNIASATAASVSLTATLADNASLWRVIVRNTSGATTSTAASLTVAQRAIAPAITSDPANQAVIEGETASFTSAASGTPAPSIQWQTRPAATTTQATWTDIPGANAATYTTSATTPSANGRQYRALFNNSAGSATTLPATLTVSARIIAPSITTQPIAQTVQAGQLGLFSITASGTSPLNYQWFKNGQALVAANATEVLIPANAADVGTSYQISVQVSNSAGTVTSVIVSMAVTAVPATETGTPINAAQGGVITTGTGAEGEPSLVIPPGALPGNTTMRLVASSSAAIGLPAGTTALGDVLEIGPSGLTFNSPVTLYLPVPANIPEGNVLAVIELPSSSAASGSAKTTINTAQSAVSDTNLGRVAKSRALTSGVMMAASAPTSILCANSQDIRGGYLLLDLEKSGARYFVASVAPESCTSNTTTKKARVLIPSSSTVPCAESDWAQIANGGVLLVSRHVQCGVYVSRDFDITGSDNTDYGTFRWEVRVGSSGPAKNLNKTFTFSSRLSRTGAASLQSLKRSSAIPTFSFKPVLGCSGTQDTSGLCQINVAPISVAGLSSVPSQLSSGWSSPVNAELNLSWNGGDGTWTEFSFNQLEFYFARPGFSINLSSTNYSGFLSEFSPLRCDKKIADGTTDACVYARSPAVLILDVKDNRITEAAQHIREAQAAGSPGGLSIDSSGVATVNYSNALQRTQVTALKGLNAANRNYSCVYSQSLIALNPKYSSTCIAKTLPLERPEGCDCDEYPFNSTWNGSYLSRNSTSAKYINKVQNQAAGNAALFRFYANERVIDYTPDPSITFRLDLTPEELSNAIPTRAGGDNFWVHVE
jgi:VCBS repeat-containing protein